MKTTILLLFLILISFTSCKQVLDKAPLNIVTESDVFTDPNLMDAYQANVYSNMYLLYNIQSSTSLYYGQNFLSELSDECHTAFTWLWTYYYFKNGAMKAQDSEWYIAQGSALERWSYYPTIRQMNVYIDNLSNSKLSPDITSIRIARMKFCRAFTYFVIARDIGAVPLITHAQSINAPVDSLATPRTSEEGIYNFCLNELTSIISSNILPSVAYDGGNPTLYAALALKSQIALYAANISKWGTVQLNGLLGVSPDKANGLYQETYDACNQIISGGPFTLYNATPSDPAKNFQDLFLTKTMVNPEVIYSKEYNSPALGVTYSWDPYEFPYASTGSWPGEGSCPYLEMAEEFEWQHGTPGSPGLLDPSVTSKTFTSYNDLWGDKDPRFKATLYTHDQNFQGRQLQMNRNRINSSGTTYQSFGIDYPGNMETGFGVLKHCNYNTIKPTYSSADWIVFRLGYILLNYAEAAFELGNTNDALNAVNQIRVRAGIQPLTTIDRDKIRHERKVELAFENGYRYYDLKAWRLSENLLSQQYSGLTYTVDDITGNFNVSVMNNVDGGNPPLFQAKNYYLPIGVDRLKANPQLAPENPGW